jgi:hypothetical protein
VKDDHPPEGLKQLPNDIGGVPAEPIQRIEYEIEPWEKRCHALADVIDFYKIINTEKSVATSRSSVPK